MSSTTLTIAQLGLSPLNVRTYTPDAEDTAALEASILAEGLLNPIAVHPLMGKRRPGAEQYGAVAGGRRYRAIKRLIERGDLPAEWPVRVVVHADLSDAQLIELSITENLIRKDLRDHELFAGVARAAAKGHDVDQIARGLGNEDTAKVARWLRLGRLAEPVFAALTAGTIDLDRARAYGATEDHALQRSVFAGMAELGHRGSPADIRRALKVGDAELTRLLRFVGEDAYRTAGGRYELDLFAEDAQARGRIVDEGTLRELVDAKIAEVRGEARVAVQDSELRFVPERPVDGYRLTDWNLQITPERTKSGSLALPEGDVVGHVLITEAGDVEVTYWWASRSAKHGSGPKGPARSTKPLRPVAAAAALGHHYDDARAQADAAIREDAGASADSVQIFRFVRQAMLRGMLTFSAQMGDDLALDYLLFAQVRMTLGEDREAALGMRRIAPESTTGLGDGFVKARQHIAANQGDCEFRLAAQQLRSRDFMAEPDQVLAFRHFRASEPKVRNLAAAIVAGLALERSLNADGYRVPLHDMLGAALADGDQRRWAAPSADLLDLLPRDQRLAIAEPLVESVTFAAWSRMKSADLTDAVLAVLHGNHPAIRSAMKRAAETWVHPLLRFVGAKAEPVEPARELEAAE